MKQFALLLLLLAATAQAQIKPGEQLTFSASYNMSGLMTPLAQVTMQTNTVKTSKSTYLHLSCRATTYSKWDSFFKIRDVYESYVHPTTYKPSLYKRDIFEGKYSKQEKYIFKGNTITSSVKKQKNPESRRTFNIGANTQDVVTLLYKLRTVDFSKFKPGQIATFTVVFDEKEMNVSAKYIGKESVDAGNLGKKDCYKISIAAKTAVLKGVDKNLIWLTADSKKVPALVRFSIPVGTGQLSLTKASGI